MRTGIVSLIVVLSSALIVSGCADLGAKDNEEIARSLIEAWSAHDIDRITALFAEDCLYEEVPSGRSFTSREDIAEYVHDVISGVPDTKMAIVSIVADSDMAAVEWVWKGTNTTGWPSAGIPATGSSFELRGISIMTIENGLITRNSDYWDWGTFLKVVGVE